MRLDFPSYAEQYIQVQIGLDHEGYVLAKVINQTPLAVRNLQLTIEYPDTAGKTHQTMRVLSTVIPAGQNYVTNINVGPYANASVLKSIRIQVANGELIEQ